MQDSDIQYLENSLSSFIDASINRVSETFEFVYSYRIKIPEMKEETGRQRLSSITLDAYLRFFASNNIAALHDPTFNAFNITIDLRTCTLTPSQSRFLTEAMAFFRSANP